MSVFHNYAAIWLSLVVISLYLLTFNIFGFDNSKFGADLFALTIMAFISAATFPAAMRAMKDGIQTGADRFVFSYWLIWFLLLLYRIWIIFVALMDRPLYLIEGPISGLIAVMIGIAGTYGVAAPLTGPETLHRRDIIAFGVACLISGIIGGMAIGVYILGGWVN